MERVRWTHGDLRRVAFVGGYGYGARDFLRRGGALCRVLWVVSFWPKKVREGMHRGRSFQAYCPNKMTFPVR